MSAMPPQSSSLNDRVTTFLDALAMLAIAAGIGLVVAGVRCGVGLLAGGLSLASLSVATQLVHQPRRPKRAKVTPLRSAPGPDDPGDVHVMGG
jgi:hypothetical protein